MYISVRQYNDVGAPADLAQRVNEDFLPIVSAMPGFLRYYAFDAGHGVVVSVSIFNDKASSEASNQQAMEWVQENLASLFTGDAPMIVSGEVFAAVPDPEGGL
ncbi:hypothetical protein [Aquisalimonas sp.]|uniref:hypothetical protein n=1 Tax=Aquisalimonas sp. TaxID=1872621 RepID=UPI0025BD5932|nr:hypothetical protein [Aquisalimonas sp.]